MALMRSNEKMFLSYSLCSLLFAFVVGMMTNDVLYSFCIVVF